ncbi:MAG: HAMP domain-containing sensor histidine kinase [Erysipelotrichaceae bacterium]
MMKNIRNFVRDLSLTQQLMTLVISFIFLFSLFVMLFLSGNITEFVRNQMYGILHQTQANVIYNYKTNLQGSALYGANDPNIIHVIFFTDKTRAPLTNSTTTLSSTLMSELKTSASIATETTTNYVAQSTRERMYFSATRINSDAVIVSIVGNSYTNQFKAALFNSVINIMLIVVSVIFILLLTWVGYLIHPLNQIRAYIEKIRRGEPAELHIDRHDEIGEVATALVRMSEEIKRQEQLKEEMVQNISHDLKTPIATIKSYGESIKDGIYPYETLEKSVDVIIEHANRLEKKVHSLLLLNRMGYLIAEDKLETKVDMRIVAEKAIISLKVVRPDIALHTDLSYCFYTGSEEPWRVVIENLLDNALRYAKSEVILQVSPSECSVYNDGPLIDDDRMSKLFKPYEKGTDGQFGLGLAIVQRVVTAYGFTIQAMNMDNGVKFVIRPKQETKKKKPNDEKSEVGN